MGGMRGVLTGLAVLSFCFGCTSGNEPVPPLPGSGAPQVDNYPPGPYGSSAGAVIEPFCWDGYRDPSAGLTPDNVEEICLFDMFNPAVEETLPRLLLISAAALDCQPCKAEAVEQSHIYPEFSELGLEFLTVIAQRGQLPPPSIGDLDSWIDSFETTHPQVIDPNSEIGTIIDMSQVPANIIVDTTTMRIEQVKIGKPSTGDYDGWRVRLTAD